jgi:hypothetical protein
MASRTRSSAISPSSSGRPTSGALADDCTLDTASIEDTYAKHAASRLENWRPYSNSNPSPMPANEQLGWHSVQSETLSQTLGSERGSNRQSALENFTGPIRGARTYYERTTQPEMLSRVEKQLDAEIRRVYAALVKLERECIFIQESQSESNAELSGSQWQKHILLHEDLLNRHFDILFVFLKSQHPSASLLLKEFGDKNFMPARMWRHGIHTFLEVLRQKYPETVEYILRFSALPTP